MGLGRYRGLPGYMFALVLLAGCQTGGSGVAEREGYFSWVDEQGRVRYSRIPDGQREDATRREPDAESVAISGETNGPEAYQSTSDSDRGGAAAKLEENLEYTTENYPDGEELAKKGFIRPGQRQPYFTWRDADGIVRVSYYTPPDMRTEEQKRADQAPVILSDASVYLPVTADDHTPVEAMIRTPLPYWGGLRKRIRFSRYLPKAVARPCQPGISCSGRKAVNSVFVLKKIRPPVTVSAPVIRPIG